MTLKKEVCPICAKTITIGQTIVECCVCDRAIHYKCYNKSNKSHSSEDFYCMNCIHLAIPRYNPFELDNDADEDTEIDNILVKVNHIHNNCNSYSAKDYNRHLCNQMNDHSSIIFQNIDGNKSNFDTFAIETRRYNEKFTVIALAETNENPESSSLYQLTGYNSFYQNSYFGKKKGTGVALYVNDSLNATVDGNVSHVTEHLETLFVTISSESIPITVGVVYRPPSGNVDEALSELSALLDKLPKCSYISGDFNIDLHDKDSEVVQRYEDIMFSRGFFPLISIATHEKPGCKPSCIDNIITNNVESVIASGTLKDRISHHSPIFQIFDTNIGSTKANLKYKQYYDYCQSNVDEFLNVLEHDLDNQVIHNFTSFHNTFRECIEKTCKLQTPKCTKRTIQNNPWITPGLIASISRQHQLYDDWVKVRKVKCKLGEKDNRGGICHCTTCNEKRRTYKIYSDYRRTLKKTRQNAKSKYFTGKFLETKGSSKKTWELINRIRGKQKRQIKPLFNIDNEKVTNRRVIANEFNKYFVSLASKLNEAHNELGELVVNRLPNFSDYLPRSTASSIYICMNVQQKR